ncbi:MAG: hypothetical protein PHP17_00335 [Candidatus Omnitrophica bacterium]|nr:hypothetical protein [Candidatus Omnitrophota bacterium]
MSSKKENSGKGALILLIAIIILAVILIVYQHKIIRSLKMALGAAQSETVSVDLGDKFKDKKGTFVAVNYDKDTLMGELIQIKAKLAQTQEMLNAAKGENESLKQKNAALNDDINKLTGELRLWEGKITSLDEKKLVAERRTRCLKELGQRIRDLKVKAQQEVDKVKMELGNQGFITKGGKTTFSREKIIQLEKIVVTHTR